MFYYHFLDKFVTSNNKEIAQLSQERFQAMQSRLDQSFMLTTMLKQMTKNNIKINCYVAGFLNKNFEGLNLKSFLGEVLQVLDKNFQSPNATLRNEIAQMAKNTAQFFGVKILADLKNIPKQLK